MHQASRLAKYATKYVQIQCVPKNMRAYMDREFQNKQKSLLAGCMIYCIRNSRVFFDCGRPDQFKQFE